MRSSSAVPGGSGWSACHTTSRAPTRRCRESRVWSWSAPRYQLPSLPIPTNPACWSLPSAKSSHWPTTGQDVEGALEALARELDAPAGCTQFVAQRERPGLPHGKITPQGIAATLVALIPEQTIVVDESISVGHRFFPLTGGAAPHDWLNSVGASLGYALPVAIGAAIAAPDRRVLALVGDGSAMYTLQALWTMAREALNITVVILANRSYNVLRGELNKIGVSDPGPTALGMLSLSGPELDWVALARGHGVPAGRAHDLGELAREMQRGLSGEGPYLIELLI
jgi:acetolactate synthase-1/2/3 large subunit